MAMIYRRLEDNPGFYREFFVTCITCFSFIMFGVTRSYSSFSLPQLLSSNYTTFDVTEDEASWVACFIALMNPLGCMLGGIIMDAVGRRITLQLGFIPLIFSWAIIALATNIQMVYIGAIGLGIGVGITFCGSTYIAEVTRPRNRGMFMSFLDPTYVFGILLCNVLVNYLYWNKAAFVFGSISVFGFVCLFFIPESPLWLLSKCKSERALKNLSWLHKKPAHEVYPELEKLQVFMEGAYRKRTICEYLRIVGQSLEPLRMLVLLSMLQQATGYTVMIGYTVLFFQRLNLSYDSFQSAIVYSAVSFVSSFFIPSAIGRFPRKTLLTYSAAGMAVSMFVIAAYDSAFGGCTPPTKPYQWLPLFCSYVYVVSSNYGVFPLPFIISGEVFPLHVRGLMQGVFGAICFLMIAFIIKIFPDILLSTHVSFVAAFFGLFSILTALYSKYVMPETKGKSLQDIQENYYH